MSRQDLYMKNYQSASLVSLFLFFYCHSLWAQFYVTSFPGLKKNQEAISKNGITIHISEKTVKAFQEKGKPFSIYLRVGENESIQSNISAQRIPTAVSRSKINTNEVLPLRGHQIRAYSGLSFTQITGASKVGNTQADIFSDVGYKVGFQWEKQLLQSWAILSSVEGSQYQLQTGNGLLSEGSSGSLAGLSLGASYHEFSWAQFDAIIDYREELFLNANGTSLLLQKKWLPAFSIKTHVPLLYFEDHDLSAHLHVKSILASGDIESGISIGGHFTYAYHWDLKSRVGLQSGFSDRSQGSQQFSQNQKEVNFLLFYNYEFGGGQ